MREERAKERGGRVGGEGGGGGEVERCGEELGECGFLVGGAEVVAEAEVGESFLGERVGGRGVVGVGGCSAMEAELNRDR